MAKSPGTLPPTDASGSAPTDERPLIQNIDIEEQVLKFQSEWGDAGANVKIERQDERNAARWFLVGSWPLADFGVEVVKDNGGGQYRGRLHAGGVRGSSAYFYFAIDPRIKPRYADAPPVAAASPSASSFDMNQFPAMLRETIKETVAATVAAFPKGNGLEDTMALISRVRDLFVPSPAAGAADPVDALARAFEAGQAAARASEGGGADYSTVVREVGLPLISLGRDYLKVIASRRGPTAPAPAVPGNPEPGPRKGGDMGLLDGAIRVAVSNVVEWARAKEDPGACAATVLEQVPESYLRQVYDKVHDPGFTGYLMNQFPTLREHESWLTAFVAGMREQLSLEPSKAGDGDDPAGDE